MTKRSRTRYIRGVGLAKDGGRKERGRWTVPNAAKDWPFWPPPENRCPVSTLDSNVALPPCTGLLWRINIKSSPWYPYCIIRRRLRPTEGRQATKTVIWRNSISLVPHLRDAGSSSRNNCRCDAGLSPIRPRKRHSIRRSAQALYIARTQIQSTVRFILSWENEKRRLSRSQLYRSARCSSESNGAVISSGRIAFTEAAFVASLPPVPFPPVDRDCESRGNSLIFSKWINSAPIRAQSARYSMSNVLWDQNYRITWNNTCEKFR